MFLPWARANPYPDCQVVPVELPGRGVRRAEPPCVEMGSLVDRFVAYLAGRPVGERFALYGHSMGATLAYEVARRLGSTPGTRPAALVVSGAAPPGQPAGSEMQHMADDELVAALARYGGIPPEMLAVPEAVTAALPVIRADLALLADWTLHGRPPTPVECRLVALGAVDDGLVPPSSIEAWRSCAGGAFRSRVVPGDHFFVYSDPRLVVDEMRIAVRHATAGNS
jgi:medium-chain acyl-[acyl-carrier-protein] hydrolase